MTVETEPKLVCLNCNRTESEIPLVNLRYKGRNEWICSQCLPVLIHHAHELADKLSGDDRES